MPCHKSRKWVRCYFIPAGDTFRYIAVYIKRMQLFILNTACTLKDVKDFWWKPNILTKYSISLRMINLMSILKGLELRIRLPQSRTCTPSLLPLHIKLFEIILCIQLCSQYRDNSYILSARNCRYCDSQLGKFYCAFNSPQREVLAKVSHVSNASGCTFVCHAYLE